MLCYAEPVVWNHDVNADPVVVNHGVPCCTSGRESQRAMLSQWLRIALSYAKPVIVNNGESRCASGCESCAMLSQWL